MRVVEKAFAYITRGDCLLVFDHVEFPEAGTQVPAGTVVAGEPPEVAVVREAQEETGLDQFSPPHFLGITEFDARPSGKKEKHRRHFSHLAMRGSAPKRWRHHERDPSDGNDSAIEFDLYWLPLSDAKQRLAHEHGVLIDVLRSALPNQPTPAAERRDVGSGT